MLIGFNAPTAGPLSAADNLAKIVVGAEAIGFDYATFSDHIVIPTAIAAEFPTVPPGNSPAVPAGAARTTDGDRLDRRENDAAASRDISHGGAAPAGRADCQDSLDHRRSGRPADAGYRCGLDARGVRGHRGAGFRCTWNCDDEDVRAFVELWTKDAPKFDGKHVKFSNIGFDPKPVQKRIRRSGSEARAVRRCDELPASAMPGIRSAPTRKSGR